MPNTNPAANRGGSIKPRASEPREVSLLELDAARQAAGHPKPDLHKPTWPGDALRETAAQQASLRARLAQETSQPKNIAAQAAGHSAGKAARVPRNTEPCSLEALIIGALCGIAMIIGLGVAWHWFVDFVKQNLPAIGG